MPGRHVRQVGHPQLVRPRRPELARDQIRRPRGGGVRDCRHLELPAPHRASEPALPHEPCYRAAGDRVPFALQLLPDLAHPVDFPVLAPHPPNVLAQGRVPPRPGRAGWRAGSRSRALSS